MTFDATKRAEAAGALADTLVARGKHYEGPGGYAETAQTAQSIKEVFRASPNWRAGNLSAAMRESLDMMANKIARVLNGNANHADSWRDLAGYATLAEKACADAEDLPMAEVIARRERTHNDGEVRAGVLGKSIPRC